MSAGTRNNLTKGSPVDGFNLSGFERQPANVHISESSSFMEKLGDKIVGKPGMLKKFFSKIENLVCLRIVGHIPC